ncbi:MAG TPA: NAD-dependent epimerase/dehydratase family protein [Kofleriaceae bacterium]|nr:NAD-dependent epimerase/dehydratase family protein [Kofleriaceae bacterium]
MSLSTWFVLGAGYTGTALARRLAAEGQRVIVTRRALADAEEVAREVGAEPRAVDLARANEPAPEGSIVVCLAPPNGEPHAEIASLVALAAGAAKLVYVSSTGVYAPGGGAWVDEHWPLAPTTVSGTARLAAERALPATAVILRAAGIYGPGRGIADRLGAGTYRIVGDGRAHVSRIHVDDLVEAIIRAGTSALTGPINCADDDPAPIGALADRIAAQLGVAPAPRIAPEAVGAEIAGMLTADRRIANTRMKAELGVVLRHPVVGS